MRESSGADGGAMGLDLATPAPKRFRVDSHRLVPPAETVERLRPLLPVLGITRVANVTGLDVLGIPVVMVCRPNARSLSVSQGKGLELMAARASGLMEALELHHAERITSPLKLASYDELRFTHRVVKPERLPRLSISAFHPGASLLWIEGRDLMDGEPAWLPFELVHTNYTLPLPAGSGAFLTSSTGLASGNHPLEALIHGICEVIERDAKTLWEWLDEQARHATRIHLTTIDGEHCQALLRRFERTGIEVALWELTSDVGVPAFRCLIAERETGGQRPLHPAAGVGCHPDRQIALLRAILEAIQSRMTMITGSRDDMSREHYERLYDPDFQRQVLQEIRLHGPRRDFRDVPTWEGLSFDEDLRWLLERLRTAGFEQVVMVDLTKREFGIPVVRVLIPGMEGIGSAPGYVPGTRARERLRGAGRKV